MKTKKIILLIITLALVCVVGFSGLVGAFAEELQRLQDVPFFTMDDSIKDQYGFVVNCQLTLSQKISNGSSTGFIFPVVTFFDPSTTEILGGRPSTAFPSEPAISNGGFYSSSFCIQRTSAYQYVALFYAIPEQYLNTFSDIPYITGFTLTNNDGTTHNVSSNLVVPQLGTTGIFFVIPPAGSTATINVNVELGYRSYTDAEYEETYQAWVDAEYRESLLQADVTDLESQLAQRDETIDELELRTYNDQIYIAALEEANDGLSENYNNLKTDYDALEIDYLTTLEDYEYEKTLRETYQELLGEANNQIEALQQMVTDEPVAAGFGWIVYAFNKIGNILEIELVPGISIGLLCLIPLVLGVVFFVLRLIRGE